MKPEILNVDILDDKEPHVFVQTYTFPDQVFQVFRKPTSQDETFELSPGEEIDPDLYWTVGGILFDTADDLRDEDTDELFALVYLDEENPSTYDETETNEVDPVMMVAYDPKTSSYYCQACVTDYEAVDASRASTLDETLTLGTELLYEIMAGRA